MNQPFDVKISSLINRLPCIFQVTIEVSQAVVEILMLLFADLLRFPLIGPEKLMMREFFAFPDFFFWPKQISFFQR